MSERQRTCIAIDLKSYYASVECMARGLDPMTTNLVVADISRTEKTICLAVSPSLKAYVPRHGDLKHIVDDMVYPAEPVFLKWYSGSEKSMRSGSAMLPEDNLQAKAQMPWI